MKPWEENWQSANVNPWEEDWQTPSVIDKTIPDYNMGRGAIERAGDLGGGFATTADVMAKALEKKLGLGGFEWQGDDVLPTYLDQDEWAGRDKTLLGDTSETLKGVDAGYVPNHTWEKLKGDYNKDGLSLGTIGEGAMFSLEQGTKSLADMIAVMTNPAAYIAARSGEIGDARAENKGKTETDLTDVVEAAPAAVASALLERFGVKGILGAGKNTVRNGVAKTFVKEGGKAALKEGGTEAIQEGVIEYLGEKFGTGADMSIAEAAERALAGSIGGAGFGGMAGGVTGVIQAKKPEVETQPDTSQQPEADLEMIGENVHNQEESLADIIARNTGVSQKAPNTQADMQAAVNEDYRPVIDKETQQEVVMDLGEYYDIATRAAQQDPEAVQMLEHNPDPMVSFPDGSVAPASEAKKIIEGMSIEERSALFGQGQKQADPVPPTAQEIVAENTVPQTDSISAVINKNVGIKQKAGNTEADAQAAVNEPYGRVSNKTSQVERTVSTGERLNNEAEAAHRERIDAALDKVPKTPPLLNAPQDMGHAPIAVEQKKSKTTIIDDSITEKDGVLYDSEGNVALDEIKRRSDKVEAKDKARKEEQAKIDEVNENERQKTVATKSGKAFATYASAQTALTKSKRTDQEIVEVDGGFELQTKQTQPQKQQTKLDETVGALNDRLDAMPKPATETRVLQKEKGLSSKEKSHNKADQTFEEFQQKHEELENEKVKKSEGAYEPMPEAYDVDSYVMGLKHAVDSGKVLSDEVLESVYNEKPELINDIRKRAAFKKNEEGVESIDAFLESKNENSEVKEAWDELGKASNKLSANPFLDPELLKPAAKLVKAAFGWPIKKADKWLGGVVDTIKDSNEKMQGSNPTDSFAGHLSWLGRVFVQSNDGIMRALANKYDSKTITKIADMFYAVAGEGNSTGKTYQEAVQEHGMTNLTKLHETLAPFLKDKAKLTQIVNLIKNPDQIKGNSPIHGAARTITEMLKSELEYMREAGLDVGEVKDGYFPRMYDSVMIADKSGKFIAQAAKAYQKMDPELSREDAMAKAEAWRDNVLLGDVGVKTKGNDFTSIFGGIPAADGLKGRVFDKASEKIMEDFLIQDPVDVLTRYFTNAPRRAEFERRLGGDKWKELKQSLMDEGAYAAIDDIVKSIQSTTGTMPTGMSQATHGVLSYVRLANALTFLPHATLTSISELALPALRSGDARLFLRSIAVTYKTLRKSSDVKEIQEITTELLGLTGKIAVDTMMSQRVGGTFDSKRAQHIANNFFSRTYLHQYTEATRIATADIGMTFIKRIANEVASGHKRKKSSSLLLKEMGITDVEAFSKWLSKTDINKKSLSEDGAMQEQYKLALTRFMNQTIMNPHGGEKPRYASHPVGSIFYALQSFLYSFSKNVSLRGAKLTKEAVTGKGYTAQDRIALAAPMLLMTLPILIQTALSAPRDEMFEDDSGKKKKEKSATDRLLIGISRSGLLGALDVYLNLFKGLRYDKDPATAMLGPELGLLSEVLKAGSNVVSDKNSDNTNTAERNMAKKSYDLMLKPLINGISSVYLPPVLGGIAIQAASHPATREAFMSSTAGKYQDKSKGRRRQSRRRRDSR